MSFTESLEQIVAENHNGLLGKAAHWERVRLGDVSATLNGYPFPSERFTKNKGIPLVRIRDVHRELTEAFFDGPVEEAYLVEPGELLVGMDGDFHVAFWRGPRAALNQRVCKITPDPSVYSRRLLAYVLPGYLATINATTSSVTVKHLSSRTIADIPLPLPPRREQDRLVAAIEEHLSRLDAAVAGLERVRAQLPRYRAAVLKAAFEGCLQPLESDLVGSEATALPSPLGSDAHAPRTQRVGAVGFPGLPEGWRWVHLGQIARTKSGGTPSRSNPGNYGGSIPWVKSGELGDGLVLRVEENITEAGLAGSSAKVFPKGTLCIALYGATVGKLGILGLDAATNQAVCAIFPQEGVLVGYLSHFLRSIRTDLVERGKGGAQPNISQEIIRDTLVPLPPTREQSRIVREIDRLFSIADTFAKTIDASLRRAPHVRMSILHRAFEGALVARDANEESADVLLDRIRNIRVISDNKTKKGAQGRRMRSVRG